MREPSVVAKPLKPSAAQEHLLQQLGKALIIQWDAIPDALQDLLIDQSVVGAHAGVERSTIERFIATAPLTSIAGAQIFAG